MRKAYLILVSVVCVLLAVLLAAGAIGIFQEGSVRREKDPTEPIYTPENVAKALTTLIPLFAVFIVLVAAGFIPALKSREANRLSGGTCSVKKTTGLKHEGRIRTVLIAAALIIIIAGVINGSARDVLIKAITICTECVGLG